MQTQTPTLAVCVAYALRRPAASTMALWWLKRLIMAELLFSLSDLFEGFDVVGTLAVP